jgi:photosystem II stability/assembly factor-like uncharacterized protein
MKKLSRIWGIGLTLVLLASMLVMAAPVSAGTNSFSEEKGLPSTTSNILIADTLNIVALEVSADSGTMYAAATDGAGTDKLYQSTNQGASWSSVSLPDAIDGISFVAMAPDDEDIIVVSDGTLVYISENGGSSFNLMNDVDDEIKDADDTLAAIFDIAISPLESGSTRYVAVAGTDDSGVGCIFYYKMGTVVSSWKNATTANGFNTAIDDAGEAINAIAFSPNFVSDQIMLAVSSSDTDVVYHIASFNQKEWDDDADFTDYPKTIIDGGTAIAIASAEISLDPEYMGGDDTSRIGFVSVAGIDGTDPVGGLYRLKDASLKELTSDSNDPMNSVSWDGNQLVGGYYLTNVVARCDDALASSPTLSSSSSNKRIGVDDADEDKTIVRIGDDGTVYGVKSGLGAGFSVSTDDGKTWNSISLMNIEIDTLMDISINSDASIQYLLTYDDNDLINLFRKDSSWQRVFALDSNDTTWIVRAEGDTIYVANQGAQVLYYSADGGTAKWIQRGTVNVDIQDMVVQDEDIAYISEEGENKVYKTTNAGFTWSSAKDTKIGGDVIESIKLIAPDNILVAGAGYVAYSTDGASSWTKISTKLNSDGATQATADSLASGGYIFAATSDDGSRVERWQIGQSSTSWKNMAAPTDADYGVYGIGLYNGALYVITSDGTDSELLRTIELTTASPAAGKWSVKASAGEGFDRAPQDLIIAGGAKLWVVDTNENTLFSLTDTLSPGVAVSMVSPAANYSDPVNPVSGGAQDIIFIWSAPTTGDLAYEIQILASDNVTELTTAEKDATDASKPSILIGPGQQDEQALTWAPGETYYWRVRVSEPFLSQWSASRSFSIMPLAASVPDLLSPAIGGTIEVAANTTASPSFSWSPAAGTDSYRFQLSNGTIFAATIDNEVVANTGVAPMVNLEPGKTYYWRVRSESPVEGEWSAIGNFTVVEKSASADQPIEINIPAPIINIPETPAPEITVPPASVEYIAPGYIWAIIIIGAVLVIAVIVLIVRTRRSV